MLASKVSQLSLLFFCMLFFSSLALVNCNVMEEEQPITLLYPSDNAAYHIGRDIVVALDLNKKDIVIDSIRCFLDSETVNLTKSDTAALYVLRTNNHSLGEHEIIIKIWYDNAISSRYQTKIVLLSDLTPVILSYQMMQQYPHDTADFTQGLFYENDIMYEGTGIEGHSKLKKYEPNSGKLIQEYKLPNNVFGEGITVVNDKIYQLPYKNKIGSVYYKQTLEKQRSFYWAMEGWGITYDSVHLIISTGSQYLYFVDTSSFEIVHQVQVADDKALIKNINELEYVNGYVWANIWNTDEIIKIDPVNGKVLERLNLKGILEGYEAKNQEENVLNGIAYNNLHKSFYITGKKWPYLFEIKLNTPMQASVSK